MLDNIVLKIQCCTSLINKYLDMHPDLKKDYPKIPFDVETENIDFNEITKEYELKYQKKERELNDYYNTIVNRLNNKLQNNDISKKKKRGFSFFKKK